MSVRGKRDGPIGLWPIHRFVYRADRMSLPQTLLPIAATGLKNGWCDGANDPLYNQPATLPYLASTEQMWREDHAYDLVGILGHNDAPPIAHLFTSHPPRFHGDRRLHYPDTGRHAPAPCGAGLSDRDQTLARASS